MKATDSRTAKTQSRLREPDMGLYLNPGLPFDPRRDESLDWEALENLVYDCDSERSVRRFLRNHPFTFAVPDEIRHYGKRVVTLAEEDAVHVANDARRLLALAIELLYLAKHDGECTRAGLSEVGVRSVQAANESGNVAVVYAILESTALVDYLRTPLHTDKYSETSVGQPEFNRDAASGSSRPVRVLRDSLEPEVPMAYPLSVPSELVKSRGTFLETQRKYAESLPDGTVKSVIGFSAGPYPKTPDEYRNTAGVLASAIMTLGQESLDFVFTPDGPIFSPGDSWSRLWLDLAQMIQKSDPARCKCCGRPFLSPRKKGRRRDYCTKSCRSLSIRTRRYWRFTREDGLDPETAATRAHISSALAESTIRDVPSILGSPSTETKRFHHDY